jgi:hypothetical protein
VPTFAGERECRGLAVTGRVEHGAHGDELADPVGTFGHEHTDGVGVAEAGPGCDRVGEMQLGGVVGGVLEGRGDAALRVARRGVRKLALGEHEDRPAGARGVDGTRQAGDPTAEHQQVEHQPSLLIGEVVKA